MSLCGSDNNDNDIQELKKNYMKISYSILNNPNATIIPLPSSNFATKETIFIYSLHSLIIQYCWIDIISFELIKNKRTIQCLHIKNKSASDVSNIILFSQDEKSDLGSTLPFLIDLSTMLKISIITYEYNDRNKHGEMTKDLTQLFTYLNKINTIKKFILFGFSIGAYNSIALIDTKMTDKVSSMILLSPNWGCSPSLLKHYKKFTSQIIKEQMDLLQLFTKPVMLIHSKMDVYIKYMLSYQASKEINTLMEWYPKKGTHWDVHFINRTKLYMKLKKFLEYKLPPVQCSEITHFNNPDNYSISIKGNYTPKLNTKIANSFQSQKKNEDYGDKKDIMIINDKKRPGLLMEIDSHEENKSNNISNDSGNNNMEYYQSFKLGELIPTPSDHIDWNTKKNTFVSNVKSSMNSNNLDKGFTFTDQLFHNE